MLIHFYTAWDNVQSLEAGDKVQVWNKSEAKSNDVHISLNQEDYIIDRTPYKAVFEAKKIDWKVK